MISFRRRLGPRTVLELLPEALLLLDPGGDAVAVNAAARRLLRIDFLLPPGGLPLRALGPDARRLAALLEGPGEAIREFDGLDGGHVCELRLSEVRATDGELLLRVVRLSDVSRARREAATLAAARDALGERVRVQTAELQALRARLEEERARIALDVQRLLAVEENADLCHWLWRPGSDTLEFSPNAGRLLGVPERAVLRPRELPVVADRERIEAWFQRVFAGAAVDELRFRACLPGATDERLFSAPAPLYQREDGRIVGAIGLMQDITDGARAALQQEELNRGLAAEVEAGTRGLADLVRQLEGFAYMATHELRAPLRAINGHAAIALDEHADRLSAGSVAALQEIVQLANGLDARVDDLRALAALAGSASNRVRTDIAPLARTWMRAFPSVPLECAESLVLEWDPVRGVMLLRQLVVALCERATRSLPVAALRLETDQSALLITSAALAQAPAADALVTHLLRACGLDLRWTPGALRLEPSGETG